MSEQIRENIDKVYTDSEPPNKVRRISRACIQCRTRKQRCDGPSSSNSKLPCRRCCQLGATCSFTSLDDEDESSATALTNRAVIKIQKQVRDQQRRIEGLEQALKTLEQRQVNSGVSRVARPASAGSRNEELSQFLPSSTATAEIHHFSVPHVSVSDHGRARYPSEDGSPLYTPAPKSRPATESAFTMDAVDLDTPMSTLRNLANLSEENASATISSGTTVYETPPALTKKQMHEFEQDPVTQGIITPEEAQQAFDIFWSHCYSHAPFLCGQSQRSAAFVRETNSTLFLSVCAVGARFWQTTSSFMDHQGLHPRYSDLIVLLDTSLSRLLLQPNALDVNIDHIRSLLLYIQWMPVEEKIPGICRTRYNDISAWSVLGLAIRYSLFLGLDRGAIAPFSKTDNTKLSEEDFSRMRVWINLLTCDCHLMLSAGLPASLDAEPVILTGKAFSTSGYSLRPEDSRMAALSELVGIANRAAKRSGDPSARVLDLVSLKKANADLDDWESRWTAVLSDTVKYTQMPFTSLRWYRLALNSAGLGPILASAKNAEIPLQLGLLQALENSLVAASQTIYALSKELDWRSWQQQSQELSAFPNGTFLIDEDALGKFRFAVDSSWIAHSFAAVFLVLCYTRGAIDDELQILQLAASSTSLTLAPHPPRSSSLFFRLISLASQIFDTVCRTSSLAHPATDYRTIIHNVFSIILRGAQDNQELGAGFEVSVEDLFEMMLDTEFNWQEDLFRNDSRSVPTF